MIGTLTSTQSRKAWVAGLVSAGLTPVIQLLAAGGSITLTTLVVALIAGLTAALSVYATTNEKDPADLPAESAAVATAVAAVPPAVVRFVPAPEKAPVDHLLEEATKDFGGQSISD